MSNDNKNNVVTFPGKTGCDLPCEQILGQAFKREAVDGKHFKRVMVLGIVEKDDTFYIASSDGSIAEMLFLLELARSDVMVAANESNPLSD